MNRSNLSNLIIAFLVAVSTLGFYHYLIQGRETTIKIEHLSSNPATRAVYTVDDEGSVVPLDFTATADQVMDAVVHIKSTYRVEPSRGSRKLGNPFEDFFRDDPFRNFFFREETPGRQQEPQVQVGQGSGVIISTDGYIVTNNHVIENADDIEVNLHDNRIYKASVVGTDPSTDLALLRIDEVELPALAFVNSDEVKVGEWVLAVGNPFNLNSTVTAGIVSAKGRSINILKEKFAVESFIQTDAAINPGNSGGALVNLQGGLIGINTAIASPTGSYSGYGFAVPANIVRKVVEDLMTFGIVQKGVLGVMIRSVDGNFQKEKGLAINQGAYVDSLLEGSAAGVAGILPGDIIIEVDGLNTSSSAGLQELIARHRPGDEVPVKVNRDGKEIDFKVILHNQSGKKQLIEKKQPDIIASLGVELEAIDSRLAEKLDIAGGVKVKQLLSGKLRRQTQIREGFIITKVDGKPVNSPEDIRKALESKVGGVLLEGVYEDIPGPYYYGFGMEQ